MTTSATKYTAGRTPGDAALRVLAACGARRAAMARHRAFLSVSAPCGVAAQHEALVDQRDDQGDEEDDDGDGVAVPEVAGVAAVRDHVGRHGRGAGRRRDVLTPDDVDEVEQLQRADDRQERPDAQGRAEQRERDPSAGSASSDAPSMSCGLVELLGDALQPGEEQDHGEADVLPREDAHQRPDRDARIGEPVVGPRAEADRSRASR